MINKTEKNVSEHSGWALPNQLLYRFYSPILWKTSSVHYIESNLDGIKIWVYWEEYEIVYGFTFTFI